MRSSAKRFLEAEAAKVSPGVKEPAEGTSVQARGQQYEAAAIVLAAVRFGTACTEALFDNPAIFTCTEAEAVADLLDAIEPAKSNGAMFLGAHTRNCEDIDECPHREAHGPWYLHELCAEAQELAYGDYRQQHELVMPEHDGPTKSFEEFKQNMREVGALFDATGDWLYNAGEESA